MFDATYVINLSRSKERWLATQSVLELMGLPNRIRFEGVDGAALGEEGIVRLQQGGRLAPDLSGFDADCLAGEIGCALSHAAVLGEIVKSGWESALVLEDDVVTAGASRSWQRRAVRAYADLPPSWDLWYLYRCFDVQHRIERVTPRTVVPWTPQGGAAYAVSAAGARTLLDALTPVASAVDRVYAELVRTRKVSAWAASPLLVLPGNQPSIINRDNPSKKWVENGINRPPEYWPEEYLAHLGEEAPKSAARRLWQAISQGARVLAGRRSS